MDSPERLCMIARWRPVHKGQQVVLHALCRAGEHVQIGVGSANRYNVRNPFTLEETVDMLTLVLTPFDNYTITPVPDLDDGPRWRELIFDLFEPFDRFITDNPYVHSLMADHVPTTRPVTYVAKEDQIPVSGTMVRLAMARGDPWEHLVPDEVVNYLKDNSLDERFKREFGLQTIALNTLGD